MRRLALLRPALPLLAGVLIFLGEHVLGHGAPRWVLSGLGAGLLLAGLGWGVAGWRAQARTGGRAAPWPWLVGPHALFVAAALLYGLGVLPSGAAWLQAHALQGARTFAWALLLVVGAPWLALAELAAAGAGAPIPPARAQRVAHAAGTGLRLGLVLALVVTLNFVFDRAAWQWDVTYFKVTEPSQATRDAVASLPGAPPGTIGPGSAPVGVPVPGNSRPAAPAAVPNAAPPAPPSVEVGVFLPQGNAVADLLAGYFHQLRSAPGAARLPVHLGDADLEPKLAREFKAQGNGWVILRRGDVVRPLRMPPDLDLARTPLRHFDRDFLAALLEVSRPPRPAYLTIGHGERAETTPGRPGQAEVEPATRLTVLEEFLRGNNYRVQTLGFAQGLGSRIPEDAELVVIAGPTEPFAPGEARALQDYLRRGGRLLVFLEPDPPGRRPARHPPPNPLLTLLASYGVKFDPVVQANDQIYGQRTYTAADHALLVTVQYADHPAVLALRRNANQFPLLLLGAGALRAAPAPPGLRVREVIKAMPGTWADLNGNFTFDPATERRDQPALALAVEPAAAPGEQPAQPPQPVPPHILVFADSDLVSDLLLGNRANLLTVASSLQWLAGETEPAGLPTVEDDVRLRHLKGDEWLWFYLPVVAVPLGVLGLGLWVTRRGRPRGRRAVRRPAPGTAGGEPRP